MKTRYHFSRQRRQLRHLGKTLLRLRSAGQAIPRELQVRFQRLTHKLNRRLGTTGLRRALGAAVIFVSFGAMAQAQTDPVFLPPVVDPFSLNDDAFSNSYYNQPAFADIDNDGDLDLHVGLYISSIEKSRTVLFINESDDEDIIFSGGFLSIPSQEIDIFSLQLVDVDSDGDEDIFFSGIGSGDNYESFIFFRENTGTPEQPSYSFVQSDPFDLIPANTDSNGIRFEFGDLDGDGDADILLQYYEENSSGYGSTLAYYENQTENGEVNLVFQNLNPFGLDLSEEPGSLITEISSIADLDDDGDLDILAGTINEDNDQSSFTFIENVGDAQNPSFADPVYGAFGLTNFDIDENFRFDAADIDGDGDIDLLSIDSENGFQLFENDALSGNLELDATLAIKAVPNPTNGLVQITTTERIARIEVNNLMGQRLRSLNGSQATLDLSDQPAGMYLVKIVTEDNRFQVIRLRKE